MKPGDTINIVKKKTKTNNSFLLVLMIVLGFLMLILSGIYKGSDRVLSHKSDDDKDNGGDYRNNDNKGGNNYYYSPSPTYSQPTVSTTIYPTTIVTPTDIQPTAQLTVSPTQQLALPTEAIDNPNTQESSTVDSVGTQTDYQNVSQNTSTSQEEFVVPVSERSIVTTVDSNSNTRVVVPTKSIFKRIENKIKGVGGSGQFLSRPKSTATPTPTKKPDDLSPPVALGPDSSIFYMLTDTDLILGAVDKDDKRINVDEVELRGAEITMDKVLKKKGLDLGVSSGGSLVLAENGTRAYFQMPVFVDVFSHEISVDTAGGKKQIKTTPAKAVVNAIESGYLENIDKKAQTTMEVIKGGELVYKLQGEKEFNLFGRFRRKGIQYVYVDVETGDVTEGDQPLISKVLKLISL